MASFFYMPSCIYRVFYSSKTMLPNKSPEPTAVGACRSAVAVHAASRRWLSFFRSTAGRCVRVLQLKQGHDIRRGVERICALGMRSAVYRVSQFPLSNKSPEATAVAAARQSLEFFYVSCL